MAVGAVGSFKAEPWGSSGHKTSVADESGASNVEIIYLQASTSSTVLGAHPRLLPARKHHRAFAWRLGLPRAGPRLRGLICLNLVCVLCASAFTVLRAAEETADPWAFSALRFVAAVSAGGPGTPAEGGRHSSGLPAARTAAGGPEHPILPPVLLRLPCRALQWLPGGAAPCTMSAWSGRAPTSASGRQQAS